MPKRPRSSFCHFVRLFPTETPHRMCLFCILSSTGIHLKILISFTSNLFASLAVAHVSLHATDHYWSNFCFITFHLSFTSIFLPHSSPEHFLLLQISPFCTNTCWFTFPSFSSLLFTVDPRYLNLASVLFIHHFLWLFFFEKTIHVLRLIPTYLHSCLSTFFSIRLIW